MRCRARRTVCCWCKATPRRADLPAPPRAADHVLRKAPLPARGGARAREVPYHWCVSRRNAGDHTGGRGRDTRLKDEPFAWGRRRAPRVYAACLCSVSLQFVFTAFAALTLTGLGAEARRCGIECGMGEKCSHLRGAPAKRACAARATENGQRPCASPFRGRRTGETRRGVGTRRRRS